MENEIDFVQLEGDFLSMQSLVACQMFNNIFVYAFYLAVSDHCVVSDFR